MQREQDAGSRASRDRRLDDPSPDQAGWTEPLGRNEPAPSSLPLAVGIMKKSWGGFAALVFAIFVPHDSTSSTTTGRSHSATASLAICQTPLMVPFLSETDELTG